MLVKGIVRFMPDLGTVRVWAHGLTTEPVSGSGEGARPHRRSVAHLAEWSTETTLTHAEAAERARRGSGRWVSYSARSGRLKRPLQKGRPSNVGVREAPSEQQRLP